MKKEKERATMLGIPFIERDLPPEEPNVQHVTYEAEREILVTDEEEDVNEDIKN